MAHFGPLTTVAKRLAAYPEFRAALTYAVEAVTPGSTAHRRISALANGSNYRHEMEGGAYAVEMAYQTKPRAEGFFETHRRFVDVQVMVAGEELMEVTAAALLGVTQPYDEARDLTKHTDTDTSSVLHVQPGDAAVFWPDDAHMPSLATGRPALVRKTVIKVPVPA